MSVYERAMAILDRFAQPVDERALASVTLPVNVWIGMACVCIQASLRHSPFACDMGDAMLNQVRRQHPLFEERVAKLEAELDALMGGGSCDN